MQCRLVEPSASSLNSGDCFIVVTPDKIVQWLGDYCNVIEKAKVRNSVVNTYSILRILHVNT